MTKIFWNYIEVWAVQKHVNLVDLVKSFPTNIYLQKSASIQPRTSLSTFGGKFNSLIIRLLRPPVRRGVRRPCFNLPRQDWHATNDWTGRRTWSQRTNFWRENGNSEVSKATVDPKSPEWLHTPGRVYDDCDHRSVRRLLVQPANWALFSFPWL